MPTSVPGLLAPGQPDSALNVLIADDNPTDRMILGRLVTQLGHRVISAENGLEAVDHFISQRPDLVLLPDLEYRGAALHQQRPVPHRRACQRVTQARRPACR